MPTVKKQTMTKTPLKASGGVLSRAVPVASIKKGLKLLIYGRSKTGKTSLFGTFPGRKLLIGTEDGTGSVAGVEDLDFFRCTSTEDFSKLVEELPDSDYKSVGLDTGGGFQDLIVKEVLDLDEVPLQRTYGMGSGKFKDGRQMWGVVGMQFKEHVFRLLRLTETMGIDVMIIAHERNFNEEDPHGGLITPTVGAALTPGVAGWLNGASSMIGQTFVREETKAVETKVGAKTIKQQKKTGRLQFCLRVGQHPVYVTGIHSRRKAEDLPEIIVDPNYNKIKSMFT